MPNKNWGVGLELPGFTLKDVQTKPDGRRYLLASNQGNGMTVSLTLEPVAPGQKSAPCRDSLQQKAANPPVKVKDVSFSRSGDLDVMQYTVPEVMGQRINQRSLFACEFYDNTFIDLHVSKVNYAAADDPLFAGVVNSMHVGPLHRSSLDLMGEGSRLYMQHDYKDAIGFYSQALAMEKANPTLAKPLWYVLIDDLGMSYGITGDLQKAKETFDYGVSKDPTYPMFYYNLACTFAEMNDATNAESYLKKAFQYKANALPGESMPDPRTDDSFKKLMQSQEFRELAASLAQSR
ncbi:MAG TPA: tetratricopeptide repeat protein [Terriglobales bacterium]|nr:tetratricopeptide repeat protein [Terriglobales bacterium]